MQKEEIFSVKELCFLTVSIIIFVAAGCGSNEAISIVKQGSLHSYPDVPLGEALEEYMADIEWESFEADGVTYVNVSGTILYLNQEAEALVQFMVDVENRSFEYTAFEIDGVAQPFYIYGAFIEGVYE